MTDPKPNTETTGPRPAFTLYDNVTEQPVLSIYQNGDGELIAKLAGEPAPEPPEEREIGVMRCTHMLVPDHTDEMEVPIYIAKSGEIFIVGPTRPNPDRSYGLVPVSAMQGDCDLRKNIMASLLSGVL